MTIKVLRPPNVDNIDEDNFYHGDDADNGDVDNDDDDDNGVDDGDCIDDDRDGRQLKPHLILSIEFLLPSSAHPDPVCMLSSLSSSSSSSSSIGPQS